MKKIIFVLLSLIGTLFTISFSTTTVYASSQDCASGSGWYVDPSTSNQCRANGYDCDANFQSVYGKSDCYVLGGCYEEASWQMTPRKECYFKADQTPIPSDACGKIGLKCCPNGQQCTTGVPVEDTSNFVNTKCFCESSQESQALSQLEKVQGNCGQNGISTAIGCLPVLGSTNDFLGVLLKWAVGIGGGIAFALMLYAGFMIMTAQGSPDRLKAGQELLTSAIAGLILLIFSVFILKFIGVDILGLCKFGFGPPCTT